VVDRPAAMVTLVSVAVRRLARVTMLVVSEALNRMAVVIGRMSTPFHMIGEPLNSGWALRFP
jgi:hypothetical protein